MGQSPIDLEKTDERFNRLSAEVQQLSYEVHQVKGSLSANTSLTREAVEGLEALTKLLSRIDVEKIIQLVDTVDTMRGGVRVLGWLERPAKWVAAMGAAIAVVWSLWNSK